ncbi:MAG: hypothetical protein QMB53_05735, partial [Eubacteriales bacterium]
VSHDRYFINRFATRVLVLTPAGLESYEGNYDAYLAELDRLSGGEAAFEDGLTRTEAAKQRRRARVEQEKYEALKQAVAAAEQAVTRAEENLKQLETLAAKPEVYADPEAARRNALSIRQAKQQAEECYVGWEAAEMALADFEAQET